MKQKPTKADQEQCGAWEDHPKSDGISTLLNDRWDRHYIDPRTGERVQVTVYGWPDGTKRHFGNTPKHGEEYIHDTTLRYTVQPSRYTEVRFGNFYPDLIDFSEAMQRLDTMYTEGDLFT